MKMPVWTDSPAFNAQVAHLAVAYGIMTTVDRYHGKVPIAAIICLAIAAVKEFWYDATFELPKQTWADNLEDFFSYTVGIVLAMVVIIS